MRLGRVTAEWAGLVLAGTCTVLEACSIGGPPVPQEEIATALARVGRPNILLIVVDTLRADATEPYGGSEQSTPELARWAARGVVFERVRAQSSWTKISMASMMTSLWPASHGIRRADDGLAEGAVTLAEVLQRAGYRTYGVQTNGWLHQTFGFHQGFERYLFPRGAGARGLPGTTLWPHADRVFEESVRLIEQHDPEEPFFLYLHLIDVHEYAAPPEYHLFGGDNAGAYRAAVRWVDHAILERVREELESTHLLDRTVIVFASDHGEAFGENGHSGHARNVLTAVIDVPLVIRFPFPIEPLRIPSQVRNIDIAPTLLDIAAVEAPDGFEGRSLLPLITGAFRDAAPRISYASLGYPLYLDAVVQTSVTDSNWTFARNLAPDDSVRELLFDRTVDPDENVDLVPFEPRRAAEMREQLDAYLSRDPRSNVLETGVRIDPDIERRLRAMGYLDD